MTELSPLSQRIEAPSRLELPIHPEIAVWRPASVDDVEAITELHRAAGLVDHPEYATPPEQIADQFARSYVDLTHDSIVGVTAAGAVVAYGVNVFPPDPETVARVIVEGTTHPSVRGHGLGRQLLQWQRGRAQQMLAASRLPLPGWIVMHVQEKNVQGVRLAQLLGFHLARSYATVVRDLAEPIREDRLGSGLSVVPWSLELSEPARRAKNDSFRDHWGSQPTSVEQWQDGIVGGERFRPELSFVAVAEHAGEEPGPNVAGLVVTSVNHEDEERQGYSSAYVELLATRRGWRGNGIGSTLLNHVMRAAKDQGIERIVLDVDTENPTGAFGLYATMGFRPSGERSVAMVLSY